MNPGSTPPFEPGRSLTENQRVERILRDQLHAAQAEFEKQKKLFNRAIAAVPSGLPHPDGVASIQNAGRQYRQAMADFDLALKRFTRFILSGTVPDDLEK